MNILAKLFPPKVVYRTKLVAIPTFQPWDAHDQKVTESFLRSEQGAKFINACRHKVYSDHLNACHQTGNAEQTNAAVRGANDIIFFMLSLGNEGSISSQSDLVKADDTSPDERESGALTHRV